MNKDNSNNSNNIIYNYIFNKNKFSLTKPCKTIYNKNLNYCKRYSIDNNKAGFNYKGNKNFCYFYKDYKPTKKFNDNLLKNYSIQKFVKNYNQKDLNINQQSNPKNYFVEYNHFNLESTQFLEKKEVENLNECFDYCLKNSDCNSFTYFQEPYKCSFFDEINLAKNKNVNYDSYTITNETNKIQKELTNNFNKNLEKHHTKFEINNNKYTDCFTNENYNDYNKLIKNYDNICKKNIGEEYIFSNNKNNKNIKNCDKNRIKILCKPNFVEKFFNYNSNNINNKAYDNYKKRFCLLLIFIFVIITLYFLYNKYL